MIEKGLHDQESQGGLLFYRCVLCGQVVSKWDIAKHKSCPKCTGVRVRPTNLGVWEKMVQLCYHPKFWRWSDAAE